LSFFKIKTENIKQSVTLLFLRRCEAQTHSRKKLSRVQIISQDHYLFAPSRLKINEACRDVYRVAATTAAQQWKQHKSDYGGS
jgi:hypothetical protein